MAHRRVSPSVQEKMLEIPRIAKTQGTLLAQNGCQNVMDAKLTSEEYAQILQTIEMFEVISQAEPGDCQSYDILKEAYLKIGQIEAALQVSRKLAEAYLNMGLYSSALLECEGILQLQPNSPDIVALMGEIESRTAPSHQRNGHIGQRHRIRPDRQRRAGSALADRPAPDPRQGQRQEASPPAEAREVAAAIDLTTDDGNEHFAKFLSFHRIAPEDEVAAALGPGAGDQPPPRGQGIAASLLEELTRDWPARTWSISSAA